jgi:hypothetical protein
MINMEGSVVLVVVMMSKGERNKKESSRIISEIEIRTSFQGLRNSFNKPSHVTNDFTAWKTQLFVLRIAFVFYVRKNKFYFNFLTFETTPICNFISKGKKVSYEGRPCRSSSG